MTSRIRRWTAAGIAMLAAPLAVQLPAAAPASAASPAFVIVLDHNISGGQEGHGAASSLQTMKDQIGAYGPTVVTMQEVCSSQRDDFIATYQPYGWSFHWTLSKLNANCPGDQQLGDMVASPYPLYAPTEECLEFDGAWNRTCSGSSGDSLTCAYVQLPGRAVLAYQACTTHLTNGRDNAYYKHQTSTIKALARGWLAQGSVVSISGDFNLQTHEDAMSDLYRQGLKGKFTGDADFVDADEAATPYFGNRDPSVECNWNHTPAMCRSGQVTAVSNDGNRRKIDYTFFPYNNVLFGTYGANAIGITTIGSPTSQHHLLAVGAYVAMN